MALFSKRDIKNLLKKQQIQPAKGLGQNFLIDGGAARKLIEAANLAPKDIVLEIGPGLGNLTLELAKRAKKVIAVEKDVKMSEILEELLKIQKLRNVKVIKADVLKIENWKLIKNSKATLRGDTFDSREIENYKVVSNLPYYITAPVIRKFLELKNPPKEMVLMVQKEVGQRICAKPPRMNLLAVSVQFYAEPKIIGYISRKSFWPQPKVDSAIIKITPKRLQGSDPCSLFPCSLFFKIVKAGFLQPRKQILNNLSKGLKLDKEKVKSWLLKNKIKPEQRAETLSINNWIDLTKSTNY